SSFQQNWSSLSPTQIKIIGLTDGTNYTFRVEASNPSGQSVLSAPVIGTSAPLGTTAPGAPTNLTVYGTNVSTGAFISWAPPSSTGSSAIAYYLLSSSPATNTSLVTCPSVLLCSGSVFGLSTGTAYTFNVVANNQFGGGLAGTSASYTAGALTIPYSPNFASVNGSGTQATVNWGAPLANGGTAITGYTVSATPSGPAPVTVNGSTFSATITGLTAGTSYTFMVVATNAQGNSPAAVTSAFTPVASMTVSGHVYLNGTTTPLANIQLGSGCGCPGNLSGAPSASDGSFTLSGQAGFKYEVFALAGNGYNSTATTVADGTSTTTVANVIVYASASSTGVSGTIKDTAGANVASGSVMFQIPSQAYPGSTFSVGAVGVSAGAYGPAYLAAGSYVPRVSWTPTGISFDLLNLPTATVSGATFPLNLTVPVPVTISGTVMNGTTPVAGVVVQATCSAYLTQFCFFNSAPSGANGSFTIVANGSQKYELVGLPSNGTPYNSVATTVVDSSAGSSPISGVTVQVVPATATLSGTVTDASGNAVTNGFLEISIPGQTASNLAIVFASPELAAGAYSQMLAPGSYSIFAGESSPMQEGQLACVTVAAPSTTANFKLQVCVLGGGLCSAVAPAPVPTTAPSSNPAPSSPVPSAAPVVTGSSGAPVVTFSTGGTTASGGVTVIGASAPNTGVADLPPNIVITAPSTTTTTAGTTTAPAAPPIDPASITGSAPAPIQASVSATTGGVILAGNVALVVPPAALAGIPGGQANFNIQPATNVVAPGGPAQFSPNGTVLQISITDKAGNPVTTFPSLIPIELKYNAADVGQANGNVNSLAAAYVIDALSPAIENPLGFPPGTFVIFPPSNTSLNTTTGTVTVFTQAIGSTISVVTNPVGYVETLNPSTDEHSSFDP
ncbi:MAG: fibronectin type III domain-containing protein, partial [Chloroflexi bacterium]|nr:fibronectin type III domain-containing protein [Chloroflexota bacterium]